MFSYVSLVYPRKKKKRERFLVPTNKYPLTFLIWFGFLLSSSFCFKLKYPLTAVEGFPDGPNSFQGKRLKTRVVLFILQHRSLWLHALSPPPPIPPRCRITDPRPHRLRSAHGDRRASLHGGATGAGRPHSLCLLGAPAPAPTSATSAVPPVG